MFGVNISIPNVEKLNSLNLGSYTKSAAITPLLNKPRRHKGHKEEEEEDNKGCRAGFGMRFL